MLRSLHHIAIICSDYARSKRFYTKQLGLEVIQEVYREARDSYKLDLRLGETYLIELFSFPGPPPRPSYPEACGLRHLAFLVEDMEQAVAHFKSKEIEFKEEIRVDPHTGKKFVFFSDPDGLPIELYEI